MNTSRRPFHVRKSTTTTSTTRQRPGSGEVRNPYQRVGESWTYLSFSRKRCSSGAIHNRSPSCHTFFVSESRLLHPGREGRLTGNGSKKDRDSKQRSKYFTHNEATQHFFSTLPLTTSHTRNLAAQGPVPEKNDLQKTPRVDT